MNRRSAMAGLALCVVAALVGPAAAGEPQDAQRDAAAPKPRIALRVGKVVTMDAGERVIDGAVVLVRDGRIEALGPARELKVPEGYEVIDAPECWLVPGLVDCHDHIAGSLSDLNDMVYLTNPGLDSVATIEPENDNIERARTGGVTSVLLIPGSGTNMSGFGTICKTGGRTPAEVIVRSPGSLKIAQAGNPERYWTRVGRSFMNWNTRQTLEKARAYHAAWEAHEQGRGERPAFDPFFDGFRGLFQRRYPVSVHTQMYQVVMTTLDMLSVKLGLWTVLDHSEFDGWKTAPLALETDAWTICGPRGFHFDRTERRMVGYVAGWWKYGVRKLGINTDAPVIPQEELSYQAAMSCWYGWLPYAALRGVTIVPAQALGIDAQTGSIEAGKQADLGLWTGNPIDPRSACLLTMVNGQIVYDGRTGRRRF